MLGGQISPNTRGGRKLCLNNGINFRFSQGYVGKGSADNVYILKVQSLMAGDNGGLSQ